MAPACRIALVSPAKALKETRDRCRRRGRARPVDAAASIDALEGSRGSGTHPMVGVVYVRACVTRVAKRVAERSLGALYDCSSRTHFRANVGPETNLTKRRLTKCPPAVVCGKVNSPMTPPRSRARCSDRAPRGRNSKRLPRRGTSRRHAGGAFTDADGVPGAGSDSADPPRRSSSPRKPVSLNPRAP